MARFRFRLETLLKLRLAHRDERREALGKALRAEQILEGRIDEIKREIEAVRQTQREGIKPGLVQVNELLNQGRHEMLLRSESANVTKQLQQVKQETERRREALVEADRSVKVLEKLRDRQQRAHDDLERKHEAKTMDEIAERLHQHQRRVRT